MSFPSNSSYISYSSLKDEYRFQAVSFEEGWEQHRGPIFDWYNSQSCTQFQSIQHRRERVSPWYHEFIIIRLVDGGICRLERAGHPTERLKAIYNTGSLALDTIKRLPDSDLARLDESSDVLCEIKYPRVFDLLDVLAICYSLQQLKETRNYNIQYFNCYFLCWCILSMLSRSASDWESTLQSRWTLIAHKFIHVDAVRRPNQAKTALVSLMGLLRALDFTGRNHVLDGLSTSLSSKSFQCFIIAQIQPLWMPQSLQPTIQQVRNTVATYLAAQRFHIPVRILHKTQSYERVYAIFNDCHRRHVEGFWGIHCGSHGGDIIGERSRQRHRKAIDETLDQLKRRGEADGLHISALIYIFVRHVDGNTEFLNDMELSPENNANRREWNLWVDGVIGWGDFSLIEDLVINEVSTEESKMLLVMSESNGAGLGKVTTGRKESVSTFHQYIRLRSKAHAERVGPWPFLGNASFIEKKIASSLQAVWSAIPCTLGAIAPEYSVPEEDLNFLRRLEPALMLCSESEEGEEGVSAAGGGQEQEG